MTVAITTTTKAASIQKAMTHRSVTGHPAGSDRQSRRSACPPVRLLPMPGFSAPYSRRRGFIIVRHMWAVGLLSNPRPSFGCRKWRPMMSTNGSIVGLASGSKL